MGNDLTFGVRITYDGTTANAGLEQTRAKVEKIGSSASKMASEYSGLNKTVKEHAAAVTETSGSVTKLLDRYDPLGVKLRQLQADFKALDAAAASGKIAARDDARMDAVYAKMRQEMEGAGKGAVDLGLNTQYARRELMMLGKEALTGDFSRMPQTFGALATHSNLLRAAMSPAGIVVAAVAVAVGGLAVAFIQGAREMKAMNDAIAYTGDYAGVTRGHIVGLAAEISRTSTLTIGASKEIVTQLVSSGRIGEQSLGAIAQMADTYAAATGKNIDTIGADLAKLFDDPAKGAEELNKRMHFLNAADLEYIGHLVRIGEEDKARLVLAEKFNASVPKHVENIGLLEKAWSAAAKGASAFWDSAMGVGKANTAEESLQQRIESIAKLNARGQAIPVGLQNEYKALVDQLNKINAAASAKAADASNNDHGIAAQSIIDKTLKLDRIRAKQDEITMLDAANRKELVDTEQYLKARKVLEKELADLQNGKTTGAERRAISESYRAALAEQEGLIKLYDDYGKREVRQLDQAHALQLVSDEDYYRQKTDLLMRHNDIERAILDGEWVAAMTKKDKVKAAEIEARQARLVQASADLAGAMDFEALKREKAARDEAAKAIDTARTASAEYVAQLEFENSMIGKSTLEVQQLTEQRRIELALEKELLALRNSDKFKARDTNPEVNSAYQSAIAGATAAAEAAKAGAEVEIDARYRVTRAWETGTQTAVRNYLDEVSNAARQSERLFTNAFRAMDDAGVKFVRSGKLNFSSLADSLINDMIRIQWQQNVTGPMAQAVGGGNFLSGLGSMLGLSGGGSSASAVSAADISSSQSLISSMMGFPANHEGGIAGMEATFSKMVNPAVFSGAPRFHTGGIAGDEIPIIAKRGEGVFTPEQMKRLAPAGGGNAITFAPQINIVNKTSQQVSATTQQNSSGGFDIILEQVEAGIARNVSRGNGALAGVMENTYGLNRAAGAMR